ncbi:putative toxin-antitoxin system toxin component, PIN family [Desulfonatronum sp. SC1]|uniref:putative toxin-antitoxin system toxin component, PIN family n=1 Tax=Desulfonatronum sp. SC1 TaxID=2109626 RepID=UPI001304BAD0|nr:putative toxin-antitoxin system toxin component, PIN family [Desulfonatronum sp. SC1]
MKVVIDTNVLVSALLFGGQTEGTGRIVGLWKSGAIQPLVSEAIMAEYLRVLAYPKFKLTQPEIRHLLDHEILPWFEPLVVPSGDAYITEDPDDDKFIWCAMAGNAELIVSGDPHLLNCVHAPIPIISPATLLQRFTH